MMTKFLSATSKTKRQINANDKSAIMTVSVAIVLLGAFFVINAGGLTAFADVFPKMVMNTTDNNGPIHPGEFVAVKNVTLGNITITPAVNVTFAVYNEGTMDDCLDAQDPPIIILNLTTTNKTTNIITPNSSSLFYTETFVGMPGVYHCNVVFIAANVTTASNTEVVGNQTIWIDAIGSQGFWKNHQNATKVHLPILLGNQTLDGGMNNVTTSKNVTTPEEATAIFNAHKGKFDLDKLAAQLLAAKLNIWALNMTDDQPNDKVDCIAGNVTDADEYLALHGYDGIDSEGNLGKDKRDGLILHKFLDIFNNFGCAGDPPLQGDP